MDTLKLGRTSILKFNEDVLPSLLLLLYFCDKIFASITARTLGLEAINICYIIVFCILLVSHLYLSKSARDSLTIPVIVFCVVAVLFLITAIIHPEYGEWFTHPTYGIVPMFINPRSAIWAFLIIWLIKDENKLFDMLKIAIWLCFVFYILQFLAATVRGYWTIVDVAGNIENAEYSLEFGYDMVFPVSFMGAYAFLKENKLYYIPYAIGLVIILFGGSRGAIIWPVLMFLFMIPFKWRNMSNNRRFRFCILAVVVLIAAVVFFVYMEKILNELTVLLDKQGMSSRTITSILSGSFSDGNGRDQIYSMAAGLIEEGGPFGWGCYGDRYVIGNFFRWGYSHNIFLEMLVSFGYIGGSIIILLLVAGVIRLYFVSNSVCRQIIFITFLTTSLKLILSSSFWYSDSFWALIALLFMWGKDEALEKSTAVSGTLKGKFVTDNRLE